MSRVIYALLTLTLSGLPVSVAAPASNGAETAAVDDLLDSARQRSMRGDYEGSRMLAEQALAHPGPHVLEARYLAARAIEKGGDPQQALILYDAMLEEPLPQERVHDLWFRKAEAYAALERYDDAIDALSALGDPAKWDGADRAKIDILSALWAMETHRNVQRSARRLAEVLDGTPHFLAPYHQAMAKTRMIDIALDAAEEVSFRGSKKRKAIQLSARQALMAAAQDLVIEVIQLKQVQWSLVAQHRNAQSFVRFGDALLADAPGRRITAEQQAIYDMEMARFVEKSWVGALNRYDRALGYAANTGWTGAPVPALRAERQTLAHTIEALDRPSAPSPPNPLGWETADR